MISSFFSPSFLSEVWGIEQVPHGVVCTIATGWVPRSTRWVPPQRWPGASCDFWLLDPTSITEKILLIALGPKNTLTSGWRVARLSRWQGKRGDASLPAGPQ